MNMRQYANGNLASFSGRFTGKESDDELVAAIKQRYNMYLDSTKTMRRQWLINAAFSRGQQFSILHPTEDRLITLQEPPGRKRVTVDVIGPWKEHMVANMVKAIPSFEVIPETMDGSDVTGARYGSSLLDYYWQHWRFLEQYITICTYLMDFGNAFVYLNYVEDGTRYRAVPAYNIETGDQLTDENGTPLNEKRPIGDISSTVLLPHCIFTTLDDCVLDDKAWVGIAQQMSLDYFETQYGEKGKKVVAETRRPEDIYDLNRISQNDLFQRNTIDSDTATELVYFQKPCDINPDGMVVVVAGNVLLERSAWPYEELLTYPIEHFHLNKEPGEFFARSWEERQIPLQKLYNMIWSILAENTDDMGHLKTLIPLQAGIDSLSDLPEILFYNYPYTPTYLQPGDMPSYIINMIQILEARIRDVQNYHGASAGTAVSGVRSDVHAQNLQDQDMLPLTVIDELNVVSFERMGEKVLMIGAEKLTEDRMIQFTGKDKRLQIANFRGAMLGGARKVRVRMQNAFMRTKGATINNILQMYQIGGIKDQFGQPDAAKLMRLLEFALPDSAFDDVERQTDRAYYENDRMMQGQQVGVYQWQDHALHMSVLQDFMNSPDFLELFDNPDEPQNATIIQLFTTHLQQHSQFYIQALSGLAPAGNAQQGGRPQEGAGQQKQAANRQPQQPGA